jgi:two-component system OmpR family response regulator
MDGKKLLIIEDDTFLQGLAANKLQAEGFEVNTSATGQAALTELANQTYDIIILDLMLPDISGFDILKQIRERETNSEIPVLIFSNLSDDADIKKGLELGATDYLVKANFTLDELAEKVRKVFQ